MPVPELPDWVEEIVEKYTSNSEYETRYTRDFSQLDAEQQLLVVLIDLYPTEKDPVKLNDYTELDLGVFYPVLRSLEKEGIVERDDKEKKYRLAWRRVTENKLKQRLA